MHAASLSVMQSTLMNPMLTDTDYHRHASRAIDAVEATADRWLQDDVIDIDTHRTGGLLELTFPNHMKIVLNMQPPLQELWLAARTGGYHFKWVDGAWRDTKDAVELFERLSGCASLEANKPLRFVSTS
jgi:CyaY protein